MPRPHLLERARHTVRHDRKQPPRAIVVIRQLAHERPCVASATAIIDVRLEPCPGREAVLAREDELRLVQRERACAELVIGERGEPRVNTESRERGGVTATRGVEQLARLLLL